MYTRVNWQNAPSTATPVNAENLNTMDKGIADAHSQLASKVNKTDIVNNDTTGGVDKVASAEVVKVHGQEIDVLNNNLGGFRRVLSESFPVRANTFTTVGTVTITGSYLVVLQNSVSANSFYSPTSIWLTLWEQEIKHSIAADKDTMLVDIIINEDATITITTRVEMRPTIVIYRVV